MALQLLSAGVQLVAAVEGNLYGDNGVSDKYTWLIVFAVVGVISAFWLLRASVPSRMVGSIWHIIVIWWMLTNIKTETITGTPFLLGIIGISVLSAVYLAVTSISGIMRSMR